VAAHAGARGGDGATSGDAVAVEVDEEKAGEGGGRVGEALLDERAVEAGDVVVAGGGGEGPADAGAGEVDEADGAVGGDEDVLEVEVGVPQSCVVHTSDGARDVGDRSAGEEIAKRDGAVDTARDDVEGPGESRAFRADGDDFCDGDAAAARVLGDGDFVEGGARGCEAIAEEFAEGAAAAAVSEDEAVGEIEDGAASAGARGCGVEEGGARLEEEIAQVVLAIGHGDADGSEGMLVETVAQNKGARIAINPWYYIVCDRRFKART
jgi:hypothetical protein